MRNEVVDSKKDILRKYKKALEKFYGSANIVLDFSSYDVKKSSKERLVHKFELSNNDYVYLEEIDDNLFEACRIIYSPQKEIMELVIVDDGGNRILIARKDGVSINRKSLFISSFNFGFVENKMFEYDDGSGFLKTYGSLDDLVTTEDVVDYDLIKLFNIAVRKENLLNILLPEYVRVFED